MTTPIDPANLSADASPTEPVPPLPAFAPAQSATAFQPAPPEPMPVGTPIVATGSAIAPTPAVAKPARKSGGVSILNVALGVAVLVATAGVAFAVGRSTAPAAAPTQVAGVTPGGRFFTNGGPGASLDPNGGFGAGPGANSGNGNGNGGRFGFAGGPTIEGTVDSITADSVTIKTADGNTITIGLDSATTYHQQADATASDVEAGKTVILKLSGGFRPGNGNGNGNGNAERQRLRQPRHRQRRDRRPLSEDPRRPCTCSWSRMTSASPAR